MGYKFQVCLWLCCEMRYFYINTGSGFLDTIFVFGPGNAAVEIEHTGRRYGLLTQSVEYLPFKQRAVGSSPTQPTTSFAWVRY